MESWLQRDPILRLRRFMESRGWWDSSRQEALEEESRGRVEALVEAMQALEPQGPAAIFEFMYAEMPWNLREQLAGLESEAER